MNLARDNKLTVFLARCHFHFSFLEELFNINFIPMNNNREEFKLILVGNQNVGKTCLIKKYVNGTYNPNQYPTSSANCFIKDLIYNERRLRLNIWDTAGQEKYNSLVTPFFRNAQGAIVVCDLSDETTIQPTQKWVRDVRNINGPDIPILFLGNKKDIADPALVKQAKDLAKNLELQYMETSAQDDPHVDEPFLFLIEKIIQNGFFDRRKTLPKETKKSCCS